MRRNNSISKGQGAGGTNLGKAVLETDQMSLA